mgnify:CR=1 FL=1
MLRDITIGQHFPGNSLVHKFDPRLKLVLTIAYIILLFAASNPLGLVLSILFLVGMYAVAKIPFKLILKSLKPILPIVVFTAVLNLFFVHSGRPWSLYVIGAAAMLWIWLVVPLVLRQMPLWLRLGLDACAVGVYVYLISIDLHGLDWYLGLALPIILTGGAIVMALGLVLSTGRSILTSVTLIIGAVGLFIVGIEFFVDRWLTGTYQPGWALGVAAVCVALMVPLIIVRRRPALRDEVRRRFHM